MIFSLLKHKSDKSPSLSNACIAACIVKEEHSKYSIMALIELWLKCLVIVLSELACAFSCAFACWFSILAMLY